MEFSCDPLLLWQLSMFLSCWSLPLPILIVSLCVYLIPVPSRLLLRVEILSSSEEFPHSPTLIPRPMYYPKREERSPARFSPAVFIVFGNASKNPSPTCPPLPPRLLLTRMKVASPTVPQPTSKILKLDLFRLLSLRCWGSLKKWPPTPAIYALVSNINLRARVAHLYTRCQDQNVHWPPPSIWQDVWSSCPWHICFYIFYIKLS